MKQQIVYFIKTYWLALAITAFCFALQATGLVELLRYDRQLAHNGEIWRWISAHFVHSTWAHFWMNMGALGLMWLLFAKRLTTGEWLFVILFSSALGSVMLEFLNPELKWYVGLSGTLHGIILAGAWREWKHDRLLSIAVIILTAAKLIYEQLNGPLPGSEDSIGGAVIVDAHLYGGIAGIISIMLIDALKRAKTNVQPNHSN